MKFIDQLPLPIILLLSLTLGLAPFNPEPHIWEKLKMLASGELRQFIDIFDLFMHSTPWIVLVLKLIRLQTVSVKDSSTGS
ncbi:MAG: RND transporter [Gammaproteobacteria bacterium]|nr:RND transporter [Gammaproteobacteria bacterium]MDH5652742.1 RND transporter [Gammaproteobacteria bacterium]